MERDLQGHFNKKKSQDKHQPVKQLFLPVYQQAFAARQSTRFVLQE
jgi:hypothetical protein